MNQDNVLKYTEIPFNPSDLFKRRDELLRQQSKEWVESCKKQPVVEKLVKEKRCYNCDKMLASVKQIDAVKDVSVEIKCPRCKKFNNFLL